MLSRLACRCARICTRRGSNQRIRLELSRSQDFIAILPRTPLSYNEVVSHLPFCTSFMLSYSIGVIP